MRHIITLLYLVAVVSGNAHAAETPQLSLAEQYQRDIDPGDYWVSEKYDGVRAYWDGSKLLTRRGNHIHAPMWFTSVLPANTALDGELWLGRSRFEELSGIVRRKRPRDADWKHVRYMVFDMPACNEIFDQRLIRLKQLIDSLDASHIRAVPQQRVASHDELMTLMHRVVALGGEGLMLRRANSSHRAGRSGDLLKLKPYDDAEAVVIDHIPGRGRLQGMTGSLLVETPDGRRFRLGSGLSDRERRNPPSLGSTVTYRFRGLNKNGLPRFASFLRSRPPF